MKITAKIISGGNFHLCKVCGNIKQHACANSNTCLDCLAAVAQRRMVAAALLRLDQRGCYTESTCAAPPRL